MKTSADLLELTNRYYTAHEESNKRLEAWHDGVKTSLFNILNKIKLDIENNNKYFASNLSVIKLDEPQRIIFQSGNTPGVNERGFQIYFDLLTNGKVVVYAATHAVGNNQVSYGKIATVTDLQSLTEQFVCDLLYQGIERIHKTSFLFEE